VRDIELPDAAVDARRGTHPALARHHAGIGDHRGIARDEDEDFRGVAKTVIAHGQPAHDIGRDVVDEDEPQRQPAEQVEPDIATGSDDGQSGGGHARHWYPTRSA